MKPPTGVTAAARAAYRLAEQELGADAIRFRSALLSYTYAVDSESRARAEWEAEERPLVSTFADGRPKDVHPLMRLMIDTARSAAYHGAQLGLSPASAKRIGTSRGRGRPVGSNSAPDRAALPPLQLVDRPGLLPGPLMRDDVAAVNRARGHVDE